MPEFHFDFMVSGLTNEKDADEFMDAINDLAEAYRITVGGGFTPVQPEGDLKNVQENAG